MRVVVLATGAVMAGAAGALVIGMRSWDRTTEGMVDRLAAERHPAGGSTFQTDDLAGLPSPVVRYFEYALTVGQPLIRGARVEHTGEFRGSLDADWSPFRSVQHYSADPPGFVWDARIDMVPVAGVRVRDSYLDGRAAMEGRVAGLIPVVSQEGSDELASGALHRFLAEAAWLPTALLPREGLWWEAVDDSTARVTLTDSGITVSLDVHFGSAGEIVRVEAERYRDVDGKGVLTPFVGRFTDYAEVEGIRIPLAGEVEWILAKAPLSYWRGRIEQVEYTFVEDRD